MTDITQPTDPTLTPEATSTATPPSDTKPVVENPTISIDDFAKIDLRIVRILEAEAVPEADKLLRLIVDLGDSKRQIFAGIKAYVDPQTLIGQLTVIVANLAPRKMRFGLSEGMLIVASDKDSGSGIFLLHPESGATPGMRVK